MLSDSSNGQRFRTATKLWRVVGSLRRVDDKQRRKLGRVVILVAPDFHAAAALAEAALLDNWSNQPHVCEVYSVRPFELDDDELTLLKWPEEDQSAAS